MFATGAAHCAAIRPDCRIGDQIARPAFGAFQYHGAVFRWQLRFVLAIAGRMPLRDRMMTNLSTLQALVAIADMMAPHL